MNTPIFRIRCLTLLVLCTVGVPSYSWAATFSAANCSQSGVQTAINSASNGDTVTVPAGNCTWTSIVNIGAKAITLQGEGVGKTNITHNVPGSQVHIIQFKQHSTIATRITGFTFLGGSYDHRIINCDGSYTSAPFRFDHNDFTTNTSPTIFIDVYTCRGLIDHNNFLAPGNSEMIHNFGNSTTGWSDSVAPGSPDALYVEDNTFINNSTDSNYKGNSALQSYNGSRLVFRYNLLDFSQVDEHGTNGAVGARWWEIYNNTFNTPARASSAQAAMDLRAGSGVVFNNHKTGVFGASIGLREEDPGYPALYQIGRGNNQNYSPVYLWGNDASLGIWVQGPDDGSAANVIQNRDFFVSATQPSSMKRWQQSTDNANTTYSYVPFTYPYPLDANGMPNPSGTVIPASINTVIQAPTYARIVP